jgi:hypothetical protein
MSIQQKQIAIGSEEISERLIRFTASTEEEDRDGDIMVASGCIFKNFARNPQFLGFHNYHDFPLGVPKSWGIDQAKKQVYIDVYFPTIEELSTDPSLASEKAKLVDFTYRCYKTKMLNAVSIGFDPVDEEKKIGGVKPFGHRITSWELIELSAVPIPSNPGALADSIKSYDPSGRLLEIFDGVDVKSAIPYHKYPHAEDDAKWDGPSETAKASIEDLAKMCAWKSDKSADDMTKSDYKLPHHLVDGYKTVRAAVIAAGNAIMGSRGGVSIPDSDVDAVKTHLEKHYHEFDIKAPWEEKSMSYIETKSGRRLSAESMKTLEEMKACRDRMNKCHDEMKECEKEFDDLMTKLINGNDGDPENGEDDDESEEPTLEIND